MKIFNSIGHFFAWILQVGLPKGAAAAETIASDLGSPLAAAIASLLGSKGQAVQSGLPALRPTSCRSIRAIATAPAIRRIRRDAPTAQHTCGRKS